jgi:hypothetical protein
VAFRIVRPAGLAGQFTGAGTSAIQTPPLNKVSFYDVRMPIQVGDYIGLDCCGPLGYIRVYRNVGPGEASHSYFSPPDGTLVDGAPARSPDGTNQPYELMIAADIEVDADADGFGDETQDQCLGVAGPQNGCPVPSGGGPGGSTPDTVSPVLSAYNLSPSAFRAAAAGPSVVARKTGSTVKYTLSEAATVKFTVERKTRGRKVGKKCKKKRRSNRSRRPCTRYVLVAGSFEHNGKAGANSFRFSGRIGGKALKRGNYRLVAIATDATGNKSAAKRHPFRIVR